MKLRWVGSIAMGLVLLCSCGTPNKEADETPAQATPEEIKEAQEEAEKIIERQLANLQEKEASTFPCSLFPQEEIEGLAGNPLDKGSYMFNHVSENDRNYRSE